MTSEPRSFTSTVSRPIAVAAAAVAVLVAGAPPAVADGDRGHRPEVQKHSCAGAGGTYSTDSGTKACTTVETDVQTEIGTVNRTVVVVTGYSAALSSTFRRVSVVEVTTTRSQRGNGVVVLSTSTRVLSTSVVPLTCTLRERSVTPGGVVVSDRVGSASLSLCAMYGLFA